MRAITVFLAPPGSATHIRGVLTDLSAAGLLSEFYWIDDQDPAVPAAAVDVTAVREGVERVERLADILADPDPIERLTLGVVVTASADDDATSSTRAQEVSSFLHDMGPAGMVRLRLVVAKPGGRLPAGAEPALDGWHNVLVAPEDGNGPQLPHVPVASPDPLDIARRAAPVFAALTGLWSRVPHRPLDDVQPLHGATLCVARSYYRQLECGALEDKLRAKLLDVGGALPLPSDPDGDVVRIDGHWATRQMADTLFEKHRTALIGERLPDPVAESDTKTGWRQLLRMFRDFLFAALRNAPKAWLRGFTDDAARGTARRLQDRLLGSSAATRVVVGGRTADGTRVQWQDRNDAAKDIARALDEVLRDKQGQIGIADLSAMWKDYANAACTLCDGQGRATDLPPVKVGSDRAVLRTAGEAVRAPRTGFVVPVDAARRTGIATVAPSDVIGIEELAWRLHELEEDGSADSATQSTLADLEAWKRDVGRTFGYAFGRHLASALFDSFGQVQRLLERLRSATEADSRGLATRRWPLTVTQILIALTIVAAATGGFLIWRHTWTVLTGVTVVGVWLVLAVAVAFGTFFFGQLRLFQLLHERHAAEGQVEVDLQNLRTALGDIERLSQAIGQYQSWSHILGTFLDDPLGFASRADQVDARPRWGLPRSTALGEAVADDGELDDVVEHLHMQLFTVGWLSEPWRVLVADAGQGLGAAGAEVRRRPETIWRRPGRGSGSPLDVWAKSFGAATVAGGAAATLWHDALLQLARDGRRDQLVGSVEVFVDGAPAGLQVTHFRSGVGDEAAAQSGWFDPAIFSDSGRSANKHAVARSSVTGVDADLGWIAVTTQFTDGLTVDDLAIGADHDPSPVALQQVTF